MSDSETSSAIQEEEVTDLGSAVRRVLKNAFAADGVARGLHEGMTCVFLASIVAMQIF